MPVRNIISSSVRSSPSDVPKDLFENYQNPKVTYIDTPFDKRQSQATIQLTKTFLIQIIWHPN